MLTPVQRLNIITGPRRSGKSVLSATLPGRPLYVNFEDPAMVSFAIGDYKRLIQAGYELFGHFDYVVLDEVQEVEGWERMVSVLRDEYPTVVTGNNARLLSREFATYLTGRYLGYTLLPFSFREFLAYKGVGLEVKTTRDEALIKRTLTEYIECDGFPEALHFGREYLINLYNDIITRDVIVHYGVRNVRELKEVAFYLFSNFSGRFTYNKTKNALGIGPMGMGGRTTALDIKIEVAHRHPASFPPGLIVQCWANRRAFLRVKPDGRVEVWQ